jgi:hypothetical protein
VSSIEHNLELVHSNMLKLLENHRFLKEENTCLIALVSELGVKNEELTKNNVLLKKKYDTLKVAKLIESTDQDKKKTRQKINQLIQEIDSCINQLNE